LVHDLIQQKPDRRLNFEALHFAIERRDPDLVLGSYAEDTRLSIELALDLSHPAPQRSSQLVGWARG
jgi:hypothetical protein